MKKQRTKRVSAVENCIWFAGFVQHLLKRHLQSSHAFLELCHAWAIFKFAGCVTDEDTDYLGHDIPEIMERMEPYKVANQQACATLTGEKEGASFWTYRDSDKKCWLKSSKAGKKEHTGLVSGNIECGKLLTNSFVFAKLFRKCSFPNKGFLFEEGRGGSTGVNLGNPSLSCLVNI